MVRKSTSDLFTEMIMRKDDGGDDLLMLVLLVAEKMIQVMT